MNESSGGAGHMNASEEILGDMDERQLCVSHTNWFSTSFAFDKTTHRMVVG